MAKTEKEIEQDVEKKRVVVNYKDVPILSELGFTELLHKFRKYQVKENKVKTEVDAIHSKRMAVGDEIIAAIEVADADSVEYRRGHEKWLATVVKGEPGKTLNEDKLRETMMKVGKLDAATVAAIIEISQDTAQPRKPYARITFHSEKEST